MKTSNSILKLVVKRTLALLLVLFMLLGMEPSGAFNGFLVVPAYAATIDSGNDIAWGDNFTYSYAVDSDGAADNGAAGSVTVNGNTMTVTATASKYVPEKDNGCGNTTPAVDAYSTTTTVTIKNTSGRNLKVTYSVSNATVSNFSSGGTLTAGASFTVSVTATPSSNTTKDAEPATGTVTVTAGDPPENITVRFVSVTNIGGSAPGSYTVTKDGETQNFDTDYTATTDDTYVLKALVNSGYNFEGWYVNGVFQTTDNPWKNVSFADDPAYITAQFNNGDALATVATLSGTDSNGDPTDPTLTKNDFAEFSSSYIHTENTSKHTMHGENGINNDYGPDEYFSDPAWFVSDSSIKAETSGTAEGDTQTQMGYSNPYARVYNDVIRIKVLRNSTFTFNYNTSLNAIEKKTIAGQVRQAPDNTTNFYYYISTNASADRGTIASGTKLIDNGKLGTYSGSASISVGAGNYLYLYATCINGAQYMVLIDGYKTLDYSTSVTISDFKIIPNNAKHAASVVFQDNTGTPLGKGTVKINNKNYTIGSDGCPSNPLQEVSGARIEMSIATAPTGYVFLGWEDRTAGITSYKASYIYTLDQEHDVRAIFVPNTTITMGNNGYLDATYTYKNLSGSEVDINGQYIARNKDYSVFYTNLADAFNSESIVFLLANDTINEDFTIPAGKTLVIPYDRSDDFAGGTTPTQVTSGGGPGAAFCTVTFNGNLTLDGNLVVNARQSGGSYGRAYGTIGRLNMGASSSITVNSGANLCAFGCISGGNISVKSGGNVYELLDIEDMRALLVMKSIVMDNKGSKVFPFSCFFVKNIEATVTYDSGANLYACMGVLLQGDSSNTTANIPVIGVSDSMFNLTKGTLTKKYQSSTDQTIFQINTDAVVSTGKFSLPMSYSGQDMTINTQDYYVPLCSGYGLQVDGQLTFNYYYKMLPGSTINVSSTGNLIVENGSELVLYRGNDFDTRSRGDATTGYRGYSTGGYPRNSARFTSSGSSYPFSWSVANMGSSKLTVDGTVTVNGALYVTETPAGVNTNDNGYNYLQGTGKIIYSDTSALAGTMKEAMETSTTNDVKFADIKLTSVKGLPVAAPKDIPENYTALTKDTYYGVQKGGFYVWATNRMQFFDGEELKYVAATSDGASVVSAADNLITDASGTVTTLSDPSSTGRVAMGWKAESGPAAETAAQISAKSFNVYGDDVKFYAVYAVAQIMNGDGIVNDTMRYATLQEAVTAYESGSSTDWYIQMLEDSTENNCSINKTIRLNLNGKKVDGTITIKSDGIIKGVDSTSDGFKTPSGSLTVTGGTVETVAQVNGKDYVAVQKAGTSEYSFHRFAITPIACRFYLNDKTNHAHLEVKAAVQGDDTVIGKVKDLGFTITSGEKSIEDSLGKVPNFGTAVDPDTETRTVSYIAANYENEATLADYQSEHTIIAMAAFDPVDGENTSDKVWLRSNGTYKISLYQVLSQYVVKNTGTDMANQINKFLTNLK